MVPPMQPEATPDRRTVVLAAVLGSTGLGTLAACASANGSTTSTTASAGGEAGASTASGGSSAGGESLAQLSQVPVGGSVVVQAETGYIALAQPTAGKVVGFSAICTHQGCTVQVAGSSWSARATGPCSTRSRARCGKGRLRRR
jgi:Rieske Fe-S protein